MGQFIAIHKHEYGTSVKLFKSAEDAEAIFNALPEHEGIDADEDITPFTRADFAERININFEPELGETLEIESVDFDKFDTVDFSDLA